MWVFIVLIVLTALMVLGSLIAVPLVVRKDKLLWTLGCFTGSLTLLLLVTAIFTNGDWFLISIVSILFGMSVIFAPLVINRLPLSGFLLQNKGLLAMVIDTLLLYAIIIVCGLYGQNGTWLGYWKPALLITSLCLLFPWVLFLIIRYMKANAFVKAGLCVIFGGSFLSTIDNVIYWISEGVLRFQFKNSNLFVWNDSTINANIFLLIFLLGCIIGGILLVVGLLRKNYD